MGHGFCKLHYERFMKSGDPAGTYLTTVRGLNLEEHFDYFYEQSKSTDTGCKTWAGSTDTLGYGRITKGQVTHKAHRLSYARFVGEIPDNMEICHNCDNPSCVNPNHLFVGTTKDNAEDREAKGRGQHQKRYHDYAFVSPEGSVVFVSGVSKFARDNDLQQSKLSQVWAGQRPHHKGWTKHV